MSMLTPFRAEAGNIFQGHTGRTQRTLGLCPQLVRHSGNALQRNSFAAGKILRRRSEHKQRTNRDNS